MIRLFGVMVLFGSICLLSSCSFTTDFVIINEWEGPITIHYELKDSPGPFSPDAPGVVSAAELSDRSQWMPVPFQVDQARRSVTVRLMPGRALRIATLSNYGGHDDPNDQKFEIRRITIVGPRGKVHLTDEQARRSFTKVAITLYTLTYK